MEKTYQIKPGETLTGLFKKLKSPGDVLHLIDTERKRYRSLRQAASTLNRLARAGKEIKFYQVKYSVFISLKEGHTSIIYADHSKEEHD